MKKTFRLIIAAILIVSVTMVGCKKSDNSSTTTDSTAELTAHSDDYSQVSSAEDDIANDANTAIAGTAMQGRVESPLGIVCNATAVATVTATDRVITVTYSGLNCQGTRNRTGVVVLTMPLAQHWVDAGAVLTVSIQNLVITRVSDNKSITINGTHIMTNVSGGRLQDLANGTPITHTITSPGMTITFDNGSQRSWQVARQRVYTYDGGVVITTTGTHIDGSTTGIAEWGTNRLGNPFVTSITAPMVIRQDCEFRLVSGQVTHERLAANMVATFGLDATGNPTTCALVGSGHYYFKLVWTGANGVVRTVILPY